MLDLGGFGFFLLLPDCFLTLLLNVNGILTLLLSVNGILMLLLTMDLGGFGFFFLLLSDGILTLHLQTEIHPLSDQSGQYALDVSGDFHGG